MAFRIGYGYDAHRFVEGRKLILGGIEIPHQRGLLGHSDADVLIHAICDALLGAAALGDIGKHFPDTSKDYAGADSTLILKQVVDMLTKKGYNIGNIDATLRLQKPKISPYVEKMRTRISEVTSISVEQVSVKASTTEKMGFEGLEEGASASAIVLIF